jgi:uncharacterized integral membrane protein
VPVFFGFAIDSIVLACRAAASNVEHYREETRRETDEQPPAAVPETEPVEGRRDRLRRHGRRTRLYVSAFASVALLVIVIALVVANTRQVKLDWVFGTTHASLIWIILVAAVLGWLLGITTSIVFRLRTRRRRAA